MAYIKKIQLPDELNVTPEVTEQSSIIDSIMDSISGKVVYSKDGVYVWKKYQPKSATVQIVANEYNPLSVKLNITGDGDIFSVDDLTEKRFAIYNGTTLVNNFKFESGESCINNGSKTSAYTYDASTGIITFASYTYSSSDGYTVTADPFTLETNEFIEYVVSNVDSTYPDGGEQDGYWYERFALDASLFGCTKYAVDKFTFAERTAAGGVEITHSLGEIPKISLLLISSSVTTGSSSDLFYWFCDYRLGVEGSSNLSLGYYNAVYGYLTTSTNGLTKTSDSVAISTSGVYYQAGAEYTLISMA